MLQKFALAFKTRTNEFFADEEDDDNDYQFCGGVPPAERIVTNQHAVVVKPDRPNNSNSSNEPTAAASPSTPLLSHQSYKHRLQRSLLPSLFATVSSFHAAYLNLQTAHQPFHLDSISAADRAAVSHLRRLSDLRRTYCDLQREPGGPSHVFPLSSYLEAQVVENQSTLRKFETVFNQLQSDIDRKDEEVAALKRQLMEMEASNLVLERKLGNLCPSAAVEEGEKLLLSIGVFDAVLKEACRSAHRFTKTLMDFMKRCGWDMESVAKCICPGVDFAKRGHRGYALLSRVCLGMFEGFGKDGFEGDGSALSVDDSRLQRREFLRQFVEHCSDDAMDVLNAKPESGFARFCEMKYQLLIHPVLESSLFGELNCGDAALGSWWLSTALRELFVSMCSMVWMLHKLAMAFGSTVEIFRVQQGVEFSVVYMENVVWRKTLSGSDVRRRTRPRVSFTVVPGFQIGASVIQCRVYLGYTKCST